MEQQKDAFHFGSKERPCLPARKLGSPRSMRKILECITADSMRFESKFPCEIVAAVSEARKMFRMQRCDQRCTRAPRL
jgi:hypothetical protein